MLYTILINQSGVVNAELDKKTDLVDWAIINYLQSWYFVEKKKTIFSEEKNRHYIWLNYKHLIESMPLLQINDKSALSYRINKLKKLDLIETYQDENNTLYFRLTFFCKDILSTVGG